MPKRTALLALFLLALVAPPPAVATCGGGGGGGRGGAGAAYKTTWKKDVLKEVLSSAKYKKHGVVLYFPPPDTAEHRFFKTKVPNDASKERPFVKVNEDYEDFEDLRKAYGINKKRHVVHVVDWFGNSFKTFEKTDKSKFSGKSIRTTLYKMDKLVKGLVKKLDKKAEAAASAAAKENWTAAIKAADPVRVYKGHEAVERAQAVWQKIEAAGMKLVDAALQLPEPDRTKSLKKLVRNFKGTSVADRCRKELNPEREPDGPSREESEETVMLTDEVWNDLVGSRDHAVQDTAERVDDALRAGLAHENAARYDRARDAYALAAGLDTRDPLPLVYLGELYRHHLGQWDEAQKAFERVLELDNDDYAVAIALHGIGKMTIWRGDNEAGLALFEKSIARHPTPLCYRNLAVYWNSEGVSKKAFAYATRAYDLDPKDSYNQVFYAVYLLMNDRADEGHALRAQAEFDPSMSYNYACFFAVQDKRDLALRYLKKHFYEYESCDAVRSFEMAEARMDAFFAPWHDDPEFRELTRLAGQTPWLLEER